MFVFILLLSGCLYPQDKLAQNKIPYKDQIAAVQTAVDEYRKAEGGMLPIKTKESNTPVFQKYLIDFSKISPRFIAEPPGSSFEGGGIFQYVLVNVESNPAVKLIDLTAVDIIRDLKLRINIYGEKHGYPPYKELLDKGNGYYTLDYEKLGYEKNNPPFVKSPFSGKNLSLFIDTKGQILIDYRPDLYEALQKFNHTYKAGDDIRYLLVDNSDFVPAFSVPYTVKNNEPIFLTE